MNHSLLVLSKQQNVFIWFWRFLNNKELVSGQLDGGNKAANTFVFFFHFKIYEYNCVSKFFKF